MERYQKQIEFYKLGKSGQEKLASSRVLIVGMGALGCMCASLLARAGIGYLRMADADTVDQSNLHRQILYTEENVREGRSKVQAAKKHLAEANSGIALDPIDAFLTEENAETVFYGIDLVLDAVDNLKTRYLINRYCTAHKIPWIYAGVNGSEGMTANFLPGGPCFACFTGQTEVPVGADVRDGSTHGVLGMIPAVMASYQVTEAVKILTGAEEVRKDLLYIDIWNNITESMKLAKDPDCPVCKSS